MLPSESFSVVLFADFCPQQLSCGIDVWNSTGNLFSVTSDIDGQNVIYFPENIAPVQIVLSNCVTLNGTNMYQAFPSSFLVSTEDLKHRRVLNYSVFFRPLNTPQPISQYIIVTIAVVIVLSIIWYIYLCYGGYGSIYNLHSQSNQTVLGQKSTPNVHETSTSFASFNEIRTKLNKKLVYEPPLRLASKMSDEDRKLLNLAFSTPALLSRESTTPEDDE